MEVSNTYNNNTGLALSGGGVRAAAFHLGVLKKLRELTNTEGKTVLEQLSTISTVSGGSLVGAFYMLKQQDFNDFEQKMTEALQQSIELKILTNWRILGAMLIPGYSRTDIKAHVYKKLYFGKQFLSTLPQIPKLIINATSLATGKNWKFTQKYMGDWKIGYDGLTASFLLADAVAASSAVPGIFFPLRINVKKWFSKPKFDIQEIALCDGGVYDNQGLHALTSGFDRNQHCSTIICSDASFPFDDTPKKSPFRFVNVLKQQSSIMMERIKNMQFQDLMYGKYQHSIRKAYFSIDWTIDGIIQRMIKEKNVCVGLNIWQCYQGYNHNSQSITAFVNLSPEDAAVKKVVGMVKIELQKNVKLKKYPEIRDALSNQDVEYVANIGTRLRKLSQEEIAKLVKHGETLCGFQVRTYLPHLLQ
jgi:NTE family protein